ncbi:MAG TPA: cytochrome c, partial [Thermoanaerobaculia bacterium]|nr:cytochrome c [Thermoanaerobaculia bacterium]
MTRFGPMVTPLVIVLVGLAAAPAVAEEVDLRAARKIYRQTCEECHGPKGNGDGEQARSLGFRARDFSHSSFKCRCTPSGALPADDDLLRIVAEGLPGTPMT